MKISEIITDKYKLRIPPTVYYDLLADVQEMEEQEPILDKIRAEIIKYEGDCRLSVAEYPSCKQCTDNVFGTIYAILDKYKADRSEEETETWNGIHAQITAPKGTFERIYNDADDDNDNDI